MAVTVATVDAAIEAIGEGGQSVTIDGQTYTAASLKSLVELRSQLLGEESAESGTRPTFRGFYTSKMGY